ncbi:sugar phosphate isomerase/epimerase family protein [Pelovirga terrestris]|uniref:Sugar phosphate isomerase/epimerase n=1 Tax=Pelovirga terrestris TaxID=2771352 RepID=A0A8J6QM86_9BACT|nr:sugar phosphate isomerase/epimerase family protein [Pelovirga terrestris]MBD1399892.1 sugar phosphate isomerase/epimerase [Pelovirga terrestris]
MSELFIHVPAALFPDRVDFLLTRRLQPEVACQDANIATLDMNQLADSASALAAAGLKTVLHAPFVDFLPGASDFRGRQMTISLLEQTLILAERIKAGKIVFHPGLIANASGHETDDWLARSYVLWSNYMSWAKINNCIFCIENIYETSPTPLLDLITAINSPYFGHVFDIGHWNIFSGEPLTTWLGAIGPYIHHLHLHDNRGHMDEHLAIGLGTVPFDQLFTWLDDSDTAPSITLENHNRLALDQSLGMLARTLTNDKYQ